MAPGELAAARPGIAGWSAARRMSLLIAVGIGLHNGTEGFGMVAPLAAEGDRPSWGFLLLLGLIDGGPTRLGTAIGRQFTSDAMSVIVLALAAGSILCVVI
jgi:ZIP family zinc transporter